MTFADPLVGPASLPQAMVAAAFSRADGSVAVLAGTALDAHIHNVVAESVNALVRDLRGTWDGEARTHIRDAAAAGAAAATASFGTLVRNIAGVHSARRDDLNGGTKTRHNVLLPEATWQAVKATAATRGQSLQDALTEAAQAWVVAQRAGEEA